VGVGRYTEEINSPITDAM